jgi:hypothetical protein
LDDQNKKKDCQPPTKIIFPKKLVRPWEELKIKWKKDGLGYEKHDFDFIHIPNYLKHIQFVSNCFFIDNLVVTSTNHEIYNKSKDDVDDVDDEIFGAIHVQFHLLTFEITLKVFTP